jgi:peptidoglycan/xylan/chitin deacetylase (PgdA/CDA1 family)
VGVRAQKGGADVRERSLHRRRGVVLAYHRIASGGRDRFDLTVPPELFREHAAMLQRRGAIVPLHDLLTLDPASLPERSVALTFDDGYAAHLAEVAPVLDAHGVPATFFVTTAPLEDGGEHWWDMLDRLNPPDLLRWHEDFVNATPDDRQRLIADLRKLAGALDDPRRFRPMTAGEVRELAGRRGMTIGAHGVNHLLLPRQTPDVREQEMRASRAALEAAAGAPVILFAYPYGGVDDATASLARQVFHYSCDCAPAAVGASFDAARVPRLDVKRWTAEELQSRIDALCAPVRDARAVSFLP